MEWLDKPPEEWPESAKVFYGLIKTITDRRLARDSANTEAALSRPQE